MDSYFLTTPKTAKRREIPINDTLRDKLKALTRRLDIPYVLFNPKAENLMIISNAHSVQHTQRLR